MKGQAQRRASQTRSVSSSETKRLQEQRVFRRAKELEDAGIAFTKAHLGHPEVIRLTKECRSIRLRIEKDSDALISKEVKKRLVSLNEQLELRRSTLRGLCAKESST